MDKETIYVVFTRSFVGLAKISESHFTLNTNSRFRIPPPPSRRIGGSLNGVKTLKTLTTYYF